MGFAQSTMEEAKKQVTLQEQWNETLAKMKNQLMGLVSSGAVDTLVDAIQKFARYIAQYTGAQEKNAVQTAADIRKSNPTMNEKQQAALDEMTLRAKGGMFNFNLKTLDKDFGKAFSTGRTFGDVEQEANLKAEKDLQDLKNKKSKMDQEGNIIPVKDFKIMPLDKDTITMAGGTKLGGNVENLLQELITAVKQGSNVYLGTNKVSEALGTNLHSIG
jgi:hypothetical protein